MYHYAGNNPVKYTDPDGKSVTGVLKLIRKHRETISSVANKYEVDPVGIASVIFQEKRWGIAADLKDIGTYILDGGVNNKTPSTRSYGLAEMQLGLAGDLLGFPQNMSDANEFAFTLLMIDEISIELIAMYIVQNEKELDIKLKGSDAAGAHNMGAKRYEEVLNGNIEKSNVAKRSQNYQNAIQDSLNGKIDIRSDSTRKLWELIKMKINDFID